VREREGGGGKGTMMVEAGGGRGNREGRLRERPIEREYEGGWRRGRGCIRADSSRE
jgi:hypothetical protein